jgi:hypothetical protein
VLLYSAYHSLNPPPELSGADQPADRLAQLLKMDGTYPTEHGPVSYRVHAIPLGFGLMAVAGYALGIARHRIGSGEGDCDGPGHADSV